MKFDPTKVIKREFKPLPLGVYKFRIESVIDGFSKSSKKPMLSIKLMVINDKGDKGIVFDNIMHTSVNRIKNICDSIGLSEKFESGELLDSDLLGHTGECQVGIKPAIGNFKEGNKIDFYCKYKPISEDIIDDFPNEEVPF